MSLPAEGWAEGWPPAGCVLAIGLAGAVFAAVYDAPAEQAVLLSAVVALVVQLIAFAIAVARRRGNAIAGWALGAFVCFTALIVYGFVSRAFGCRDAALLSLATFFFLLN